MMIAAYRNGVIWGVGQNAEQALAEAEGYMRDAGAESDEIAGLLAAPMSDALLGAVLEHGRHARFEFSADGILVPSAGDSEVAA